MRVLVTGSRSWTNLALISARLGDYLPGPLAVANRTSELVVVHGDCPPRKDGTPGADRIARNWAMALIYGPNPRRDVVHDPHPAAWNGPDGRGRFNPGAGQIRNGEMVTLMVPGEDVVLAFAHCCTKPGPCRHDGRLLPPGHFTHGTHDCITRAVGAGLELHVYRETAR